MKRGFAALVCALLMMLPVFAEPLGSEIDMDYSGAIDPFTGLPLGDGGSEITGSRVRLTDNISYDLGNERFCYAVAGLSQEICADVMDGMVVTEDVHILLPDGLTAALYRDGELDGQAADGITAPGDYVLNVNSPDGRLTQVMTFTIVTPSTGRLSNYRMPEGFAVTSLMIDGVESAYDHNVVDLSYEGEYEITYGCAAAGISRVLALTVDHTPPTATFVGVEDGVAHGPVEITELERTTTVTVDLEGERLGSVTQLTQPGHYEVTVTDAAGNSTEYSFTIMLYLNVSGVLFMIVILAVVAALAVYLIRYRMSARVR